MGGIYIVWGAWTLKFCKWCFHTLQLIPTVSIALGCCFWWKTNSTVWELRNAVWAQSACGLRWPGQMELERICVMPAQNRGVQAQPSSVPGLQFLETLGALWTHWGHFSRWMLYPVSRWKGFLDSTAASSCTVSRADFQSGAMEILTSAEYPEFLNDGRGQTVFGVHWTSTVNVRCDFIMLGWLWMS